MARIVYEDHQSLKSTNGALRVVNEQLKTDRDKWKNRSPAVQSDSNSRRQTPTRNDDTQAGATIAISRSARVSQGGQGNTNVIGTLTVNQSGPKRILSDIQAGEMVSELTPIPFGVGFSALVERHGGICSCRSTAQHIQTLQVACRRCNRVVHTCRAT